jgi:hypothetical protein
MPKVLEVGLLVADVPAEDIVAEDGDLPVLFNNLFRKATASYPTPVTMNIVPFLAVEGNFFATRKWRKAFQAHKKDYIIRDHHQPVP